MNKLHPKDLTGSLRGVAPYLDLGMRFALAAALGGLAGHWLDGKLHTSPLLLVFGVMLGGTAGFINLYRTVMNITRAEAKRKQAERSADNPRSET